MKFDWIVNVALPWGTVRMWMDLMLGPGMDLEVECLCEVFLELQIVPRDQTCSTEKRLCHTVYLYHNEEPDLSAGEDQGS